MNIIYCIYIIVIFLFHEKGQTLDIINVIVITFINRISFHEMIERRVSTSSVERFNTTGMHVLYVPTGTWYHTGMDRDHVPVCPYEQRQQINEMTFLTCTMWVEKKSGEKRTLVMYRLP